MAVRKQTPAKPKAPRTKLVATRYGAQHVSLPDKPAINPEELREETDIAKRIEKARTMFQESVFDALGEIDAEGSAERVKKEIFALLAAEKKNMVMRLLGLRNDFGRVEINDQQRESIVKEVLIGHVRQAVVTWIETMFDPGELEKTLEKQGRKDFKKAFLDAFQWQFEREIRARAEQYASMTAKKLENEFAAQFGITPRA
jgi:ribosomal protein S30